MIITSSLQQQQQQQQQHKHQQHQQHQQNQHQHQHQHPHGAAAPSFPTTDPIAMSRSASTSSLEAHIVHGKGGPLDGLAAQAALPREAQRVSPALQELVQWMVNGGDDCGATSSTAGGSTGSSGWVREHPPSAAKAEPATGAAKAEPATAPSIPAPAMPATPAAPPSLDALATTMAIKNAVRLQRMGYRPGVTGGRVGLLEGLRTADMDKYDETIKPKKRRAPPTDLSGLSAEEIVARRNRLAREYSKLSRNRRDAVETMLEEDAAALRFTRLVMEGAPGIVYLTLSADMRGLVLYANQCAQEVLGLSPTALLGRSFAEVVHPDDHARIRKLLAVVVLSKNPEYRTSLQCRVRMTMGGYRQVHATFKFGAFGIACSMWGAGID